MLLKQSVLQKSFPFHLASDIEIICKIIQFNSVFGPNELRHRYYSFNLSGDKIQIPPRIYVDEVNFEHLSEIQKILLGCYFTRHHNGFIREKYLRKVITTQWEWVIPFVILLLGEYVVEILDVIYEHLDNLDLSLYRKFIENNMDFYIVTKQRMISYWNCYYRGQYRLEDYVGFKIVNKLY